MVDLIGKSLGQYQILSEIAKGGMSTVYLARQTSMGRDVAIKVLPTAFMHDSTFVERFHREVDIIARLQHPHILPVIDFGEQDEMPFIVMAYIGGGTLTDRIKRQGALTLTEVSRMVKQIADALDYAHSKGIIHRDFKPSNVLLDEKGNTYLTDFGLAKLKQASTQITGEAIIGTPAYMAPEQAGSSDLTPASDVYALGVTVFQMLTGRVPYETNHPMAVLLAHATQPIPNIRDLRATLTEETQGTINLALAKSVEDRYPTPGTFAEALTTALEARPQQVAKEAEEGPQTALLMTNMLGQVIFVDHYCLKLLQLSHQEARTVIGKGLADALGIAPQLVEQILRDVSKKGKIEGQQINVKDSKGGAVLVTASAIATYDNQKKFVGSDISLKPMVTSEGLQFVDFSSISEQLGSTEETFLQFYFTAQVEALLALLANLGGKRLSDHMASVINETAQRNVWPVNIQAGQIFIDLKSSDADIYRALLAKAITYATSVIGEKIVVREMNAVEQKLDARVREYVKVYQLR